MCDFPLFDTLNRDISEDIKDLTDEEKEDFLVKFKKLDDKVHELIYVLIRVYDMKNNKGIHTLPFNAKQIKAGYKFDIDNLPIKLKQILYKFICIEIQKNQDDQLRNL